MNYESLNNGVKSIVTCKPIMTFPIEYHDNQCNLTFPIITIVYVYKCASVLVFLKLWTGFCEIYKFKD